MLLRNPAARANQNARHDLEKVVFTLGNSRSHPLRLLPFDVCELVVFFLHLKLALCRGTAVETNFNAAAKPAS